MQVPHQPAILSSLCVPTQLLLTEPACWPPGRPQHCWTAWTSGSETATMWSLSELFSETGHSDILVEVARIYYVRIIDTLAVSESVLPGVANMSVQNTAPIFTSSFTRPPTVSRVWKKKISSGQGSTWNSSSFSQDRCWRLFIANLEMTHDSWFILLSYLTDCLEIKNWKLPWIS